MKLTRLIYASSHNTASVEVVDHILQQSRANNARDGITGALVVSEHCFLQLLEGDRAAVARTFMRIMVDKRHCDIQVVCARDVRNRLFLEWSMHLINASRIKREILSRYLINGSFQPGRMSATAVADLCRALASDGWEAMAA